MITLNTNLLGESSVAGAPSVEPPAPVIPPVAQPPAGSGSAVGFTTPPSTTPWWRRHFRLFIPAAAAVLVLGIGAALFFFTQLKYRLPFFQADESKLVSMMYDQLAKLDGADFQLTYSLGVGPRDKDVKVEEKKATVPSETGNANSNTNANTNSAVNTNTSNTDVIANTNASNANVASNTNSNFVVEDISPTGLPAYSPVAEFLGYDYLDELFSNFEDAIPSDLSASITISGSGFSLADKIENGRLPNLEASVTGHGQFNATTMELDLAAKVVDSTIYYRVGKFPFVDITQGHQGEWVQLPQESDVLTESIQTYTDSQQQIIQRVRTVLGQTKTGGVFEFKPNGKRIHIDGVDAKEFVVSLNAQKVPDWLMQVSKSLITTDTTSTSGAQQSEEAKLTDQERQQIITMVERLAENLKLTVALHPGTGALMDVRLTGRTIPPASSKKFSGKQFNSILDLRMWNQNEPSRVLPPDKFVEQAEIDREKTGLSKRAYADWRQAARVGAIRKALAKWYGEKGSYPQKLDEATTLTMDLNSGQPYDYQVTDHNYELTFDMNGAPETPTKEPSYSYFGGSVRLEGFGYDYQDPYQENTWLAGKNTTDRFSPVVNLVKASHNHVTAVGKSDYDAIVSLQQRRIVQDAMTALNTYRSRHSSYPSSLNDVTADPAYKSIQNGATFCEDLTERRQCEYVLSADKNSYTLSVGFGIASAAIDKQWLGYVYNEPKTFTEGKNTFTGPATQPSAVSYDDVSPTIPSTPERTSIPTPTATSDYYRGAEPEKADVVLVAYTDFQCPYCKRFQATMQQVVNADPKVSWVFRHSPLTSIHPEAQRAAEAAECAGDLAGREVFWKYADALFEQQASLGDQLYPTLATQVGIDSQKFSDCLTSGKFKTKIEQALAEGKTAGVTGTPITIALKQNDTSKARTISGALPYSSVKAIVDSLKPTPADLDTDNDGLNDAHEQVIGTDPTKADSDGDGYMDRTELYSGYNPLGTGTITDGSWTECVNLSVEKSCNNYCASLGKTCANTGVNSAGMSDWGSETYDSAAACTADRGKTQSNTCDFASAATDARWRCFCQ